MSRINRTISKHVESEIKFVTYVQDGSIIVRCISDDFKAAIDKLKDVLSEELISNLRKTDVNEKYLETLLRLLVRGDFKSEEITRLLQKTNKFIKLSGFSISTFLEIMDHSNTVMKLFFAVAIGGVRKIMSKSNNMQKFMLRMFSLYTFSMFYQFISESMLDPEIYNNKAIEKIYVEILNYYIKNIEEVLGSIR